MATSSSSWEPLDLSNLVERLEQATELLEQAAAMAAVHDPAKLTAVSELHRRLAEEGRGDPRRRRYR